ncbi:DDE-type integrase/transposase/recombinase, partial [Alicyclobacillus tolerans]
KKVYRLCAELDILKPQRRKRLHHPRRLANNREVTGSNQLWEMDIKYGYIAGEHRFFFLMSIIDVYDRAIVDYHIGLSCEGQHAVQILQRALWKRQLFENYQAAYAAVTEYITFYNQRRNHGSLYDLSPEQFMRAIANNEVQPFVVKV